MVQQSRKQRRGPRRTRRLRRQRGGGDATPAQSLIEWLNRVKKAIETLKKDKVSTLDKYFDIFKNEELQLPPLKKETGHAGTAPEIEPEFQLNKRGTVNRLFEDSDIRQIGNALRSHPRASLIKSGNLVSEFQNFRPLDTEDNGASQLQEIEEAMRYAVSAATGDATVSLSDEKNYPLYLFYLLMNLPADMSVDNAILLVVHSNPTPPQVAAQNSNPQRVAEQNSKAPNPEPAARAV